MKDISLKRSTGILKEISRTKKGLSLRSVFSMSQKTHKIKELNLSWRQKQLKKKGKTL